MILLFHNRQLEGRPPLGAVRIAILSLLFLANFFFPVLVSGSGLAHNSPFFPWVCMVGTLIFLLAALNVCASAGPLSAVLGLRHPSCPELLLLGLWAIVIFLAGGVAGGLWALLLKALGSSVPPQGLQQMIVEAPHPGMRLGYFLQVVLVIPAFEELIFRRGIHELLRPLGVATALILTSALFSGVHFHLPGLVTLFLYGAGFQFAYDRTGSFLSCWLLHGILNTLSFFACIFL